MKGFYLLSLGLDVSRSILGWGLAAFLVCSFSSFDKW